MTSWQTNLLNNLIVVFVLLMLGVIIYCRVTGRTIGDLIKEIMEARKYEQY